MSPPLAAPTLPLWYRMSRAMVSREGSASTSSVDVPRYTLPSDKTPKNCSATSTALHAKLHTLMTASLMPSARRHVRHCSKSPDVWNGDGRHDGGMNLMRDVRRASQQQPQARVRARTAA